MGESLKDKRVIVSGAFGALGRVVTACFAERGARLAAVDFAAAPPAGLAAEVVLSGVDLSEPAQATAAVDKAVESLGGIDALINLAGGFLFEKIEGGTAESFERMYRINLATCANMCRAALPHLVRTGGRIVNVGAGGAVKAGAGMAAYGAAKSGVHRLTEALAAELKGKVAVNAVLPSIIDTPANRADMPRADFSRWVAPADLAKAIAFLASDEARAVTGALLAVDGGL
ncbi:MAG: SDR family oxidoreductase [Caulobacteraceae bacterium]